MQVYIPVSHETIIGVPNGGEVVYNGVLPVWATRPMNVEITMTNIGWGIDVNVLRLTGSGAPTVESYISLPYSATPLTVDLSFSSVLFPTYDRNRSYDGEKYAILIQQRGPGNEMIQIPVVNADMTYGQMRGIEDALPQPPKIKMPSQPYDLFVLGQPNTVYPCVATPITGYSFAEAMPVSITSGKTVDIRFIKKLVISDYPSDGLTYEVDYEDRPWNEANEDTALQCALRVRWNMHNGQWYWAAFKSFFWSNKFTYLRGRGGVTEQAEITVNLEYTKEEYTVYQQLLASSNIFASLNIDGIMQYPIKHFKLDVSGDTGARWNGNDRVYRQQVKFRTTTLQDNYISPEVPDIPPPVPPSITQSTGTSTLSKNAQAFAYTVYSNINAFVESYPSWCTPVLPADGKIVIGSTPIRFQASENTGAERSGSIVIRRAGGGVSLSHTVTQAGTSTPQQPLTLTPNSISFPSSGDVKTVQLVATEPWTMSYNESWCNIAPRSGGAGTFTLTVACVANTIMPPVQRVGNIDIEGETSGSVEPILISQGGKNTPFIFTPAMPDILPAGNYGNTFDMMTRHNWTAVNYNPTVINIAPEEGDANTETFSLLAAQNPTSSPRMAAFRITSQLSGDNLLQGFIQESTTGGIDAMVEPDNVTADASRTVRARLVSVSDWVATPLVPWMKVFPTSGAAGCHDIIVSLDVNTTGAQRNGDIAFDVSGDEYAANINIMQNA